MTRFHAGSVDFVRPSCTAQFPLDGSIFKQGDSVREEQLNRCVPPAFSCPPCLRNDGIKRESRETPSETNHCEAGGRFDIDFGSEGSAFAMKQVRE